MAGYMDADGTFGLYGGTKGKVHTWVPRASVTSVDVMIPQMFFDAFGGYLDKKTRPGNARDVWEWRMAGARVLGFCQMIFPYLRLKKARADVLLAYGNTYVGRVGRPGAPKEVQNMRLRLVKRLKQLNQRGRNCNYAAR